MCPPSRRIVRGASGGAGSTGGPTDELVGGCDLTVHVHEQIFFVLERPITLCWAEMPQCSLAGMQHFRQSCTLRAYIETHFVATTTTAELRADVVSLAVELGRIVGTMHQHNLVHGDLTTSNVLLLNADALNAVGAVGV